MAPTVDSLREALALLSLDTRGHKDVLSRRLARHRKAQHEAETPNPPPVSSRVPIPRPNRPRGQAFDAYLCFDVEATCEYSSGQNVAKQAFGWPNEIIEFPMILLKWCKLDRIKSSPQSSFVSESDKANQEDGKAGSDDIRSSEEDGTEEEDEADPERWELRVVDEFHSFVRPKHRPKLSDFCRNLTGITQAQVDSAPYYPQVLKRVEKQFITKHNLFTKEVKTVWVTDGPWDLRDFVAKQVFLSNVQRPSWLGGHVIDLRKLVTHYFAGLLTPSIDLTTKMDDSSSPKSSDPLPMIAPESLSIPCVLSALSLPPFIGQLHSGLDDARNLSRILVELARRGVALEPNLTVPQVQGREKRWDWMGRDGTVVWDRVLGFEQVRKAEGGG
ncbi:BZ3500_MvSof-1268-A1-R1_Chr4-2g07005 [Microbotryum saponariae]|uniref:BZ3500_MvSof-1268-A1-R1_Chr4-2g07005 protein n=1 Tax=Microbotryum saponariae TaxID=289078 RepID=A0A2X0LMY6_9BASI|nr:BZ3500_MvSof-1268-A1-R1_Chr4-2g07005 [Microbotryum saponariae]SDA06670.1 BZ3501_MvSof-1269-A2-R1_Chr4-2g06716 [Microbotryum saponariae]